MEIRLKKNLHSHTHSQRLKQTQAITPENPNAHRLGWMLLRVVLQLDIYWYAENQYKIPG